MADPSSTQSGPLTDLISLAALLRHVTESLGSRYLASQALEPKVFSCEVRTRLRWHSGNPHARVLYGSQLGPLVAEEQGTPGLLKTLCEATGSGFAGLLHDDYGIYVDGKTVFVFASRGDAAKFWPWPDDKRHPQERPTPESTVPMKPVNQSVSVSAPLQSAALAAKPAAPPMDPVDWIQLLINYDVEQSAVIRDAVEHQRKPGEIPATFSRRIEPVMDDAWRRREVKKAWSAGYIATQISSLDLWPRE
jgi:hypothetical protein